MCEEVLVDHQTYNIEVLQPFDLWPKISPMAGGRFGQLQFCLEFQGSDFVETKFRR